MHLHVEVRLLGDTYEFGVWHHWACPLITPNNKVVEKLLELTTVRGLPVDCSKPTLLDYIRMANDAKDASWMLQDEIMDLTTWARGNLPPQAQNNPHFSVDDDFIHTQVLGKTTYENHIDEGVSDVRFVFWFDG